MPETKIIHEAKREFYWRWINFFSAMRYSEAARHMREAAAREGIKDCGRPQARE